MAPLSVYFYGGIWVILAFVSMAFLVSNLEYEREMDFTNYYLSSESQWQISHNTGAQGNTARMTKEKLGNLPEQPDYFSQYPSEIMAAIEGTYLSRPKAHPERQSQQNSITEVILSSDQSREILPGIVFIDDKDENIIAFSAPKDASGQKGTQSTSSVASRLHSNVLIKDLPPELIRIRSSDSTAHIEVISAVSPSHKDFKSSKDTLIVFTTCNHLDMTVLALEYLIHSLDVANLVIVDDFSLDGTAEYLRKKGYFVISKEKPMGLTDSWNKGYEFAVAMGYSYVIFANNDVLVPHGAIESIRNDLQNEVLVVPLTTMKGAGHNPGQTLVLALEMSVDVEDYVSNPNNVQLIQDALKKKISKKGLKLESDIHDKVSQSGYESMDASMLSETNHILRSTWKKKARFNGFVFAANITGIEPAAFGHPSILFDPRGLIIGQEDRLIADMTKLGMMPKISLGAFVYHFKSVTVKMSRNKKNEDSREDLSKYHLDLKASQGTRMGKKKSSASPRDEANRTTASSLTFYSGYEDIFIEKPFSRLSVYPSLDQSDKSDEDISNLGGSPSSRRLTVIAFAISDAIKYPLAGDIFTATELGNALLASFSNIKIVYLSKGVDWYDPMKLQEIDVLVALLDDYDVTKALQCHRPAVMMDGPKPTLLTIAWARNWFHRWLKQPWMGNYDLIFSSSVLAQTFFYEFGMRYGHAVQCVHGCPVERTPSISCSAASLDSSLLKNPDDVLKSNIQTSTSSIKAAGMVGTEITSQSGLLCTVFLPGMNKFGNDQSRLLRFRHDPKNSTEHQRELLKTLINNANSSSPPRNTKVKIRNLSTFRTVVPIKILQIATNTVKFVKKEHHLKRRVTTEVRRLTSHGQDQETAVELSIFDPYPRDETSVKNNSELLDHDSPRVLQKALKATLHDKRRKVLANADYAFTGSFYNVHRNIMNFDPLDLLPKFSGVIIGKGWATAPNVSEEFRKIAIGSIPYQDLPKVYQRVKIVVDDANHVTAPWGSVNSRVFDALSSGALVITNGVLGSKGTFNGELPTYSTASELSALLKFYLTNDSARKNLTDALSKFVRTMHSYEKRGEEFSDALADFGLHLKKRTDNSAKSLAIVEHGSAATKDSKTAPILPAKNSTVPLRAICVGVRTYESHKAWLEVLLRSLMAQHSKSPFYESLDLQIFIADTERNTVFNPSNSASSSRFTFSHALEEIVNRVNKDLNPDRAPQAHIVWDINSPKRTYRNPFYGYDDTDYLGDFMASLPQCEWIMMTNGDNSYNSAWFNAVAPLTNTKTVDLIGWDFITHHKRNGNGQQHIKISMTRGFVDLASVLVRTSKIVESKGRYLPDAMFTDDLFARDFYFLTELLKVISPSAIRLLHQIFLLHQ